MIKLAVVTKKPLFRNFFSVLLIFFTRLLYAVIVFIVLRNVFYFINRSSL